MNRSTMFVAVLLAAAAFSASASGQAAGAASSAVSNSGAVDVGNHLGQNNLTQDQFNQVIDYADKSRRLTKEDKAKGKTLADVLAEDKTSAIALAKSMPLSCEVTEAILAAQGPVASDGKTVNTKTYEVSCANGLGYFLISQDSGNPYGFSCFAADATRAADVAAGRTPGAVCKLPANADMKAMAASVLNKAGISCSVRDYKWVGQSTKTKTEYDEVACTGGQGYMLASALPGSTKPVSIETCHESAAAGLPCKLSDNGPPALSLQTFKDALVQHNVACVANDKDIRVIGQENSKKRYVVEFQCAQQPKGLVAFIPLAGNTAPFETLTCAAASKRGIKCSLPGGAR
ncbi:MAG: hypothetical protein KGJ79_18870 [Alphaproteobacteria bacterium]|nr:hypothetical protein [Alphaproteobacteria bacterium]MDE2495293.1 hypothetical protein [Alphaproteobacteria bacterium]